MRLNYQQREIIKYRHQSRWRDALPTAVRNFLKEVAPQELLGDENLILSLIQPSRYEKTEAILASVSPQLLTDPTFMKKAVLKNPEAFAYADAKLQKNTAFILDILNTGFDDYHKTPAFYHLLPEVIWSDRDIVLDYLSHYSMKYDKLDVSLKNDREILVKMVQNNYDLLRDMPSSLRNDKAFILDCAAQPHCLRHAPGEFLSDREFVKELIQQAGRAYQYIDASLKQDQSLALMAVKKDPYLYEEFEQALREDEAIALAAVSGRADNYHLLCQDYKDDSRFALAAVSKDSKIFSKLDTSFRSDPLFVVEAMAVDKGTIFNASQEIQDDILFKVYYQMLIAHPKQASVVIDVARQQQSYLAEYDKLEDEDSCEAMLATRQFPDFSALQTKEQPVSGVARLIQFHSKAIEDSVPRSEREIEASFSVGMSAS